MYKEFCFKAWKFQIMSVTANIKDALRITINQKPYLKACFMGTRRTDPFCAHLNAFQVLAPITNLKYKEKTGKFSDD